MRNPIFSRDHSALHIALIYAIISAVWILSSDLLISGINDRRTLSIVSIAKGWGFILVTAALIYALVQRALTRIRRAEAQMLLLFDSVNDAIYIFPVTEDGMPQSFVDINDAATRLLGYTREEFLRMKPMDLVKPELREEVSKFSEQRWLQGQVVFETVYVAKDGRETPVEVSSKLVRIDDSVIAVNVVRDVKERKRMELERRQEMETSERDKRRFYRETILGVTGGKFTLCDQDDADCWSRDAELHVAISGPEHLSEVRHKITSYCLQKGLPEDAAKEFEMAVGEALTNAVKHASGGTVEAGTRDEIVWVAVKDMGSGIDTFALPKVALLPGFTTKASMGLGYTVILAVSDSVKLSTGPTGTTVIMEKELHTTSDLERALSKHSVID